MKGFIKTFFGVGVCVGFVLLCFGFFAYLFGTLYRIAIFAGTMLCASGLGYAQFCEEEPHESTGKD